MFQQASQTLLLLALPLLTACATLEIAIAPTLVIPNPHSLRYTTRAELSSSGPPLTAVINKANKFEFTNVPTGSHLLSIYASNHIFENLRIDVTQNGTVSEYIQAWTTWRGNEWANKGELRGEGSDTAAISVHPVAVKQYYQERAQCTSIRGGTCIVQIALRMK